MAHVGQRFDIVHDSRHTEGPDVGGKWRFDTRVSALAFQRLDEPGFFAADIGAGPTVHEDIELHIRAQDVFAEVPGGVGFVDSRLQPLRPEKKFATQIDERQAGAAPHNN